MWGELGKSLQSSSAVLNFLIHHILEPVVVFVGDGGFGVIYLSPYYCEAQKCYCSSFLNFLLFWNSSMRSIFFFFRVLEVGWDLWLLVGFELQCRYYIYTGHFRFSLSREIQRLHDAFGWLSGLFSLEILKVKGMKTTHICGELMETTHRLSFQRFLQTRIGKRGI